MKYKCVLWFLVVSSLSLAWTVSAAKFIPYETVCFESSVCDESDDDLLLCAYTWSVPRLAQLIVSNDIIGQSAFYVVTFAVIRGPPV